MAVIFAILTILGSLCQGKPVEKKKKLKDKPTQGKMQNLSFTRTILKMREEEEGGGGGGGANAKENAKCEDMPRNAR